MRVNIADELINKIIETKNPTVVGLDPDLSKIPNCYKSDFSNITNQLQRAAEIIFTYNKDIIDTIYSIVPAVKPQIAFYEKYGSFGIQAFERTVNYAKSKGLIVIEDGKRNDIGNTAQAYADAHLGEVEVADGTYQKAFDVDFLTITPFLGSESLTPFVTECKKHNKGIFVLVKTSNSSSGEIQDVLTSNSGTISESIATIVNNNAISFIGDHGYSPIGAVVGATYPHEAVQLRKLMPQSIFLVPGFGAQGGSASDILPCFNQDGLGAIVNSSRAILYQHMTSDNRINYTKSEYLSAVKQETIKMQKEIYTEIKKSFPNMNY